MLTRIRNAYASRKTEVVVPYSNFKHNLAKVLMHGGWIRNFEVGNDSKFKNLQLELKYTAEGQPVISGIQRISKPGQRIYKKTTDIPRVMGGLGTTIVSTSKGLVTAENARKQKIGGEIICQIW